MLVGDKVTTEKETLKDSKFYRSTSLAPIAPALFSCRIHAFRVPSTLPSCDVIVGQVDTLKARVGRRALSMIS